MNIYVYVCMYICDALRNLVSVTQSLFGVCMIV